MPIPKPLCDDETLDRVIWTDPERMGGAPCFYGTRVPVAQLFEWLGGGDSLDFFLENFPPVTRQQATLVLAAAQQRLVDGLTAA